MWFTEGPKTSPGPGFIPGTILASTGPLNLSLVLFSTVFGSPTSSSGLIGLSFQRIDINGIVIKEQLIALGSGLDFSFSGFENVNTGDSLRIIVNSGSGVASASIFIQ